MVDAAHHSDEEAKDETFVEKPAILEMYKAAAEITNGKHPDITAQLFLFVWEDRIAKIIVIFGE
jgi:hypothetical protein